MRGVDRTIAAFGVGSWSRLPPLECSVDLLLHVFGLSDTGSDVSIHARGNHGHCSRESWPLEGIMARMVLYSSLHRFYCRAGLEWLLLGGDVSSSVPPSADSIVDWGGVVVAWRRRIVLCSSLRRFY